MSIIEGRLAKLEQIARAHNGGARLPGVAEEAMHEVRRVAAVCSSANELAAYLHTRLPPTEEDVVSLEAKRISDAALAATARSIFEEVNGAKPLGVA